MRYFMIRCIGQTGNQVKCTGRPQPKGAVWIWCPTGAALKQAVVVELRGLEGQPSFMLVYSWAKPSAKTWLIPSACLDLLSPFGAVPVLWGRVWEGAVSLTGQLGSCGAHGSLYLNATHLPL